MLAFLLSDRLTASCLFVVVSFLLQRGASLSAVNCDGDVPLDIALDEATESLLHSYTLKQGECCSSTAGVYRLVGLNVDAS